ncbi:hypothetical protein METBISCDRAFT_26771 [Metschnikowia bicuspidata]|uniref:WKF domain-containing protein n=1 Tax=Metschnikowia bicuspidata TaxID=27322 RepID=A0A4P9ZDX8_9ASCO|nr:hypothetical protein METBISCDRAFT_26771 [Metschnikowia bicuspidata]
MSKVPAWKRLGLVVKKDASNDALPTTEHLDDANVTHKQAKKIARKNSESSSGCSRSDKKPPKRIKLPKSERKGPVERDQLAYLKRFVNDREHWKFSKQKQNWLLKNIEHISPQYHAALALYVDSIQGGARTRLQEHLHSVLAEWNKTARILEARVEAELFGDKDADAKEKETQKEKEEVKGPTRKYASICKMLLDVLWDEPVEMVGYEESVLDSIVLDVEDEGQTEDKNDKVYSEGQSDEEKAEQDSNEDATNEPEPEDNLIIEYVDVEDYVRAAQSSQ